MKSINISKGSYTRRRFLGIFTTLGMSTFLAARGIPLYAAEDKGREEKTSEEVTPVEDLMREHGVLRRVLLIYEEIARRLMENGSAVDPKLLVESAGIIKKFIEDYHEKLEEDYLFPRFRKKGTEVDLVNILLQQHQAGRKLTVQIRKLSSSSAFKSPADRKQAVDLIRQFIRMYRPHAAREDTVLFPSFRSIVKPSEYDKLGELFEDKEHKLFGKNGFEDMVKKVAAIEKELGIYDLSQFTPR